MKSERKKGNIKGEEGGTSTQLRASVNMFRGFIKKKKKKKKESQNVFLVSIVTIIKNLLIPRFHGSWRHNKE